MENEKTGYSWGWRYGTFDKCNGKPYTRRWAVNDKETFTSGFITGYEDGYNSNEVRIRS